MQIKGYPVRLPLDVAIVFTRESRGLYCARKDHHAAQRSHRVGRFARIIRRAFDEGLAITAQEAWTARDGLSTEIPRLVSEVIEQIAFRLGKISASTSGLV